jgi:hypothetical protein
VYDIALLTIRGVTISRNWLRENAGMGLSKNPGLEYIKYKLFTNDDNIGFRGLKQTLILHRWLASLIMELYGK